MTHVDVILALIRSEPGLTDKQIRKRLSMADVRQVNHICRRLQAHGQIQRIPGPQGRLVNVPAGERQ